MIDEVNWVEIETAKSPLVYRCILSENTFFGWTIQIVHIRFQCTPPRTIWSVNIPCICRRDNDFRRDELALPVGTNSIVCICQLCEEPMVRVSGLEALLVSRTDKVSVFVNEELEKYRK